jgi:SHS2 domain-containing protein
LDHPADVGFVARGKTLEEAFAAAAQAMCEFGWELSKVKPRERIAIRVRAANLEDLLYSWLSEILFLCDAEKWVFRRFKVHRVNKEQLATEAQRSQSQATQSVWGITATGAGEKFDKSRHRARTYIKAVTYHQLAVKQTAKGWEVTVYLDV